MGATSRQKKSPNLLTKEPTPKPSRCSMRLRSKSSRRSSDSSTKMETVIEVDDLVALHGIMGKPCDEGALGAMIAEAPGPLDFQMLLQLFGEKMSGTDPEETIMAGWHLFDPSASGEMGVDAVKSLLCNRGVKADRLTEAEVAQMFDQVKPAGGKFNYGKFTRIMKRGSDE